MPELYLPRGRSSTFPKPRKWPSGAPAWWKRATLHLVEVTPKVAETWLVRNAGFTYRDVKKAHLTKLGNDALLGLWKDSVPPIIFSTQNRLMDGTHRLQMVIAHGKPHWFLVATKVPITHIVGYDNTAIRTFADVVTMTCQLESDKTRKPAKRRKSPYEDIDFKLIKPASKVVNCMVRSTASRFDSRISKQQLNRYFLEHREGLMFACSQLRKRVKGVTVADTKAVFARAYERGYPEKKLKAAAFILANGRPAGVFPHENQLFWLRDKLAGIVPSRNRKREQERERNDANNKNAPCSNGDEEERGYRYRLTEAVLYDFLNGNVRSTNVWGKVARSKQTGEMFPLDDDITLPEPGVKFRVKDPDLRKRTHGLSVGDGINLWFDAVGLDLTENGNGQKVKKVKKAKKGSRAEGRKQAAG